MLLKPDGLGEKLKEPNPEPTPIKSKQLSLVKSTVDSSNIENNPNESKEKNPAFVPIMEFLKKKKETLKLKSGPLSIRGVAFRKYQESLNLEHRIKFILNPMVINSIK